MPLDANHVRSSLAGLYTIPCAHEGCWQSFQMEAMNVEVVYLAMEAQGWVRMMPPAPAMNRWAFCPDHADEAF